MAGTARVSSPKGFSRTADLKLALRAHCEQRLRAFLAERGADRDAFSRLLAVGRYCCRSDVQPALRKNLGQITKLLDGELGREIDDFTKSVPEWAGNALKLLSSAPRLLDELGSVLSGLDEYFAVLDALSGPLQKLEGLEPGLSNVRRATLGSELIDRGLPILSALADSKTPEELVKTLDRLAATEPDHPNSGASRALRAVIRWRHEAVSQAKDFQALAELLAPSRKPRAQLARRFVEGFSILVGSDWVTVPINARLLACISILCDNLPRIIEGWDLDRPTLVPPLKLALVLDQETQTMRIHLRELRATRKNR